MVGLACLLWVPCVPAQQDRPEIMPGERRPAKRKDTGPRALAVLQLAANGKASLVPVAILINGKFWDASSYKADPVPMALEQGTVYEAERTGNSLGLFTVSSALHSNSPNAQAPWLATGTWRPTGSEAPTREMKAEAAPVGIGDSDAPPRLTRDPNAINARPPASSTSGSGAPSTAPPSDTSRSAGAGSDEPPRLKKPTEPTSPEPPATPGSAGPGSTAPSPTSTPASTSQAGRSKPSDAKPDTNPSIPKSDSGASEANRPRLRRGLPAESFAEEEVPGYSKPGTKPSGKTLAVAASQGDVQLIPAISDASNLPIRPFTFDWLKGEEDDRRKQMTDFAKQQLRAYVDAKAKATLPAKSAQARRAPSQEPILETVQMVAYDVWRSNQPVIILSATAHMPPPPTGAPHSEVETELQYSILLIAYPDTYNNLHKLYVGITDKLHLDVTPRLELIDAVDVDGDGVGELLFRETSDQGNGWVIYRPSADKLWKMFDSLKPE